MSDWRESIVEECPLLYTEIHQGLGPNKSCMAFGFECGDGWKDIICDLSRKLEALILKEPKEDQDRYRAQQVKEKFGTLRFYAYGTDEMYNLISEAENLSSKTCEACGAPGEVKGPGWLSCVCPTCAGE